MHVGGGAQMPHKPHSPRGCSVFLPGMFYIWSALHHVFLTCVHMCVHTDQDPEQLLCLGQGLGCPPRAPQHPSHQWHQQLVPVTSSSPWPQIPMPASFSGLCGVCVGSDCVRGIGLDEAPRGDRGCALMLIQWGVTPSLGVAETWVGEGEARSGWQGPQV